MMASDTSDPDSLYPIAVLIDELRNDDVQVCDGTFKMIMLLTILNRIFLFDSYD